MIQKFQICLARFLWAFIVGLAVLPSSAFLYLWLGYAPVATKGAPLPFEKQITALALNARISRDSSKQPGVPATEENLMAGAKVIRFWVTRATSRLSRVSGIFSSQAATLAGGVGQY